MFFTLPLFHPSVSLRTVFLAATLLGVSSKTASAQSSYLQQTFEPDGNGTLAGTLNYTVTGTANKGTFTGTLAQATSANNTNAFPTTASVASQGTAGYGVVNNQGGGLESAILTFNQVSFPALTGNYLTFRLASFQTNSGGGIDNSTNAASDNGALVSIAYNGSSTFTPTLQVNGISNGSIFTFDALGIATTTAPINTATPSLTTVESPTDVTQAQGNTPPTLSSTRGYSTVKLEFGPNITRIQVRITVAAQGKTAVFIDDVRIGSSGPLPVNLKAFTALHSEQAVRINWTTASEQNAARFEVQRSADGRHFTTVASVPAQGQSMLPRHYASQDMQPLQGLNYYRLLLIDSDGTTSFSPVVTAFSEKQISIYPNPVHTDLQLALPPMAHYRVLNLLGSQVMEGSSSDGTATLNVAQLPEGLYQVEINSAEGRLLRTFSKKN
ncbi:T9SS type A sorting domain-containing protein [Hymenobacter sp. YC55]|uniref:T9SS type A sorting domain-containing protein n=1 Tax=Hymenobacter sp. YC55 TaxID=3034019 RepID=UPI0023F91743|nr:T9SS type A sorting domain-containing protein [Hymenobacter sp. YC55]MDF7814730.1 T9SS type A sorting domain-containing protein [Hymenobacter sp. YC55]